MRAVLYPLLAFFVGAVVGVLAAWVLRTPVLDGSPVSACALGAVAGALGVVLVTAVQGAPTRARRALAGALVGGVAALVESRLGVGLVGLAAVDAGVGPPLSLAVVNLPLASLVAWALAR